MTWPCLPKKGKIQSLCPRNMMFLLVVVLVEVVVVVKLSETLFTPRKSKAKAQQDLGNDGGG